MNLKINQTTNCKCFKRTFKEKAAKVSGDLIALEAAGELIVDKIPVDAKLAQ